MRNMSDTKCVGCSSHTSPFPGLWAPPLLVSSTLIPTPPGFSLELHGEGSAPQAAPLHMPVARICPWVPSLPWALALKSELPTILTASPL